MMLVHPGETEGGIPTAWYTLMGEKYLCPDGFESDVVFPIPPRPPASKHPFLSQWRHFPLI